jgi:hypothetical protein
MRLEMTLVDAFGDVVAVHNQVLTNCSDLFS